MVMDVRGVPDSVRNSEANNFALVYNMRIKRDAGATAPANRKPRSRSR